MPRIEWDMVILWFNVCSTSNTSIVADNELMKSSPPKTMHMHGPFLHRHIQTDVQTNTASGVFLAIANK